MFGFEGKTKDQIGLIIDISLRNAMTYKLTNLTSLFILQPEDHRPMWYIHTITCEHRY